MGIYSTTSVTPATAKITGNLWEAAAKAMGSPSERRSMQMLIPFAGELQKTTRQLLLTLNFHLDIKSVSLLLPLNLMGSGSGGSSGGKKESWELGR